MAKRGMEPIRRAALVKATIAEIGGEGGLDATVAQIARRAGVSSALALHYFGSKERIFLAAMRFVLTSYGEEVRAALAKADAPRERLDAIVSAGFSPANFQRETVNAWLNFYVLAQNSTEARRLLNIYRRRLHSNLLRELRPLVGERAEEAAYAIGAMVDGVYLREALGEGTPDGLEATRAVMGHLEKEIAG